MRVSHCSGIWAVALAEMRSARRQVRTWVFSLLAVGGGLFFFIGSGVQHAQEGWISPVTEFPAPRFAMSSVGMLLLLAFLFGSIFLAFDVRARDRRERMVEVLDTRPVSNVELLLGRILGVVGTAFLAALTLVALVQAFGMVVGALGGPTEPVSILSLAAFLFVDAIPILLAWVSVVVLLAVLLRNRLLVAVGALGLLAAWILWAQAQPLYLSPLVGLTVYGNLASDLLPRLAEPATLLHRLALVVLAVGVVHVAAALHPRRDDRPLPVRFAVSAVLVGTGATILTGVFVDARNGVEVRARWLAEHREAPSKDVADIEHIAGTVRIDPGRELMIDVAMRLVASDETRASGELVLSFNPGMTVREVRINGEPRAAVHRDGLLRLEAPSTDGGFELELRADGVPDPSFAYLDSAFDFTTDSSGRRNVTLFLGRDASIYDDDYVALMPGVRWLPVPGANVGREDPGGVARDYFTVDLAVEAPAGWLVAGPGLRQTAGEGGFRFNPRSPVPAVALLASRFERQAMEVAGVELEILMSPEHADSLAVFEDAVEPLGDRLEELFGEAASAGLEYPYRGLSVVEVPATLRRCGGGWRMDTVQALPGILLLNERGFPTARFDFGFRRAKRRVANADAEDFKIKVLERYFRNDYAGGDPFVGLERNLVRFQAGVAADGMAATAVEFVVEELANLVLSGTPGFFSAHVFTPDRATSLSRMAFATSRTFGIDTGQRGIRDVVANRPAVWDLALGTSLAELDPAADPVGVLDVLVLRGGAVARAIFDALGREQTAALLRDLRERGSYDVDAFYEAAVRAGTDLRSLLGDWLNDAGLPGFRGVDGRHPSPARYRPRPAALRDEGPCPQWRAGTGSRSTPLRHGARAQDEDPRREVERAGARARPFLDGSLPGDGESGGPDVGGPLPVAEPRRRPTCRGHGGRIPERRIHRGNAQQLGTAPTAGNRDRRSRRGLCRGTQRPPKWLAHRRQPARAASIERRDGPRDSELRVGVGDIRCAGRRRVAPPGHAIELGPLPAHGGARGHRGPEIPRRCSPPSCPRRAHGVWTTICPSSIRGPKASLGCRDGHGECSPRSATSTWSWNSATARSTRWRSMRRVPTPAGTIWDDSTCRKVRCASWYPTARRATWCLPMRFAGVLPVSRWDGTNRTVPWRWSRNPEVARE